MTRYFANDKQRLLHRLDKGNLFFPKKNRNIFVKSNRNTSIHLKGLYKIARLVHIYISMVLLGLLAFFCLTGIFLNHNEWFEKSYSDRTVPLVIKPSLQTAITQAQTLADVPVTELQTLLQRQYRLSHLHQMNFDLDGGELTLDYQLPAGYATAYFSRDGEALLEFRKGSLITIMNDLHKGRHSGPVWSWVIDLSAVLMLIFSVAGLVILIQNKKYRKVGLALGTLGVALPFGIYYFWVPLISGV